MMVDEIKNNINTLLNTSFSQPGSGQKKEVPRQRISEEQTSDMTSVWKDKYLHLLADLENTKKRLARVSALEIESQNTELLRDVLPVADGLDLALNHISAENDSRNIFRGIQGLKCILDQFFIKYDVKTIDALGVVFDPNLHEAVGMVEDPEAIDHTVVRIEKKGYLCHNKLLRPAQVMVAAG